MPTSHSTFAPVEASPPSRLDLLGGATVVVPVVLPGVAVVGGVEVLVAGGSVTCVVGVLVRVVTVIGGLGGSGGRVVVSVAGGRVRVVVVVGGRDGSGLVTTTFS